MMGTQSMHRYQHYHDHQGQEPYVPGKTHGYGWYNVIFARSGHVVQIDGISTRTHRNDFGVINKRFLSCCTTPIMPFGRYREREREYRKTGNERCIMQRINGYNIFLPARLLILRFLSYFSFPFTPFLSFFLTLGLCS